jgi:hypothetical protein
VLFGSPVIHMFIRRIVRSKTRNPKSRDRPGEDNFLTSIGSGTTLASAVSPPVRGCRRPAETKMLFVAGSNNMNEMFLSCDRSMVSVRALYMEES